uniref:Uncharacterized protein n=1 Tax=Anguilla anguilla TaxID=7936 RepID=A0A0E9PSJ6_ANGAN
METHVCLRDVFTKKILNVLLFAWQYTTSCVYSLRLICRHTNRFHITNTSNPRQCNLEKRGGKTCRRTIIIR